MDKRAATGFGLRALIVSLLLALITACGGGGGGGAVKVVTIDVTPGNATLAKGVTQDYTAMANMSNGTRQNVTSQVAWSSTSPAIASITASGRTTANAVGNSTIRAMFDGVTGSTQVSVGPAVLKEVKVSSTSANIPNGTNQTLTAAGVATDGTPFALSGVTWSSSKDTVATVSTSGVVTGVTEGNAVITATSGGIAGSLPVKITSAALKEIQINPPTASVAAGLQVTLTATGIFTDTTSRDISNTVVWSSTTPALATVGNTSGSRGQVTGRAVGIATITVTDSGITASRDVEVTAAQPKSFSITPKNSTVGLGAKVQYKATLILTDDSTSDVTKSTVWKVENKPAPPATKGFFAKADTPPPPAASISAKGLLTTETKGDVDVTGTFTVPGTTTQYTDKTGLKITEASFQEIQITPQETTYPVGFEQQLTAKSILSNGTQTDITATGTWTSSATGVATVSATGLVKAIANGSATITIEDDEGNTASLQIIVVDAAVKSIQVEPEPTTSLPQGGYTRQFKAVAIYTDNSTREITAQALWTSSDTSIASISNADATKGLATSSEDKPGTTNITAKLGAVTSTATVLTVTNETIASISIEPAAVTVGLGTNQQFKAIANFSGTSTSRDITQRATWTSDSPTVATISNADGSKGLASTQSVSTTPAVISAKLGTATGTAQMTVSNAVLVSVEVTPATLVLPKTYSRPLQAIGTYRDGRIEDVTAKMTWLSSNTGKATVSNATGSQGVVRGSDGGTVEITATITENGTTITDKSNVTVTNATLASITVAPSTASVPLGLEQKFTASGKFSDEFVMDISDVVTWTSSDDNVADIGNTPADRGVATANALSSSAITITATKGAMNGTASLSVTSAAVESILVRPDSQSCGLAPPVGDDTVFLPRPFSAGLIACASFSDGITRNVSSQVTWESGDTTVVTVGNDPANRGIVSPVTDTRTVVSALFKGKRDSIPVQVTDAPLVSITVTPTAQTIYNNSPVIQFIGTGTFDDAGVSRTLNITRHVTWSAESASGAANDTVTISNEAGKQGQAGPGRAPGFAQEVTIVATRGSIKGTVTLQRERGDAP